MNANSTAYRTSAAREFVRTHLDDAAEYDVDGIVAELVGSYDLDFASISVSDWADLVVRYEIAPQPTDAELIAALARSRTGWSVLVRDSHGNPELFELRNPALVTEGMVRAHLSPLFAFNVEFKIFPLIG